MNQAIGHDMGHNSCPDIGHKMAHDSKRYEIRFVSLFIEGRALAFPCDHLGRVDLDSLSKHALENYLFARAMVGREYAAPAVRPCELH